MFDYPTIKIIFQKKRSNKKGEVPIYLQYTQRRKTNIIHLQKTMPPNSWKGEEEEYFHTSGPNSHPLAKSVNLYLQRKLLRAKNIILNAQIEEQQITFEEFKNELAFGGKSMKLQDLAERYIEKRIGEGAKKTTLVLYNTKKNKLKVFKKSVSSSLFNLLIVPLYLHLVSFNPNSSLTSLIMYLLDCK